MKKLFGDAELEEVRSYASPIKTLQATIGRWISGSRNT
jgi:hypothetical protein